MAESGPHGQLTATVHNDLVRSEVRTETCALACERALSEYAAATQVGSCEIAAGHRRARLVAYRAGVLSVREVAKLHGFSHTAIQKKALPACLWFLAEDKGGAAVPGTQEGPRPCGQGPINVHPSPGSGTWAFQGPDVGAAPCSVSASAGAKLSSIFALFGS